MGYARAGFDVTGIDNERQSDYPFPFIQGDALDALADTAYLEKFDAIHASPPCQPYSGAVYSRSSPYTPHKGKDEPALIPAVIDALRATRRPWVVESVMGAGSELPAPFILCGAMFGRPISRHRLFSVSWFPLIPFHVPCAGLAKESAESLGWEWRDMSVTGKGRHVGTSWRWQYLLDIDWPMTQHQLAEAIPPAYTAFLGGLLMDEIGAQPCA